MARWRAESSLIGEDAYLRVEDTASIRHEYVDGRMCALAGASDAHNQIVINIVAAARPQIRGADCRMYANEMRLRVSSQLYYYPDVMVVCDPTDHASMMRSRPCALLEVLSPSSQTIDQREKVLAYKQIPSLNAYLIIHQSERVVELHSRIDGDIWRIVDLQGSGKIVIPCGEIALTVEEIYEDVAIGTT